MTEPDSQTAPPPVAAGNSLRRNALYAVAGNGLLNVCRLVVVALLAKWASPAIQGTYTYTSLALAAPVALFLSFELRGAFVADAGGEFTFGAYRALRYLGMSVATVVLTVIAAWIGWHEQNLALAALVFVICAGRVLFHLAEIYWGDYQRRERLDLMAWSNTLRGVTLLLPVAGVLYFFVRPGGCTPKQITWIATAAIGIQVVLWGAIWWGLDRRLVIHRPQVDLSWTWPAIWRLARQTFPLGLVYLLINLCETVTQGLVKQSAGEDGWSVVGFFGAMRLVTIGATFIIVQISTAAGNRLAHYYQRDLSAFYRLAWKLTGTAILLGIAIIVASALFGRWLLATLYTPAYAEHHGEFMVLVSAQALVLLSAVFGFVTTHMRLFWIQVPVHVTVLAATTTAGLLLINPTDPIQGGAWTMLVRSITQFVLYLGCVLIGIYWRDRLLERGRTTVQTVESD